MKKHGFFILALGLMLSMGISAQDQAPQGNNNGQGQEMRDKMRQQMTPQLRAERMAKQLSLTDEEKAKIQAYYEKQDAEREKMRAAGTKLSREEMRTKMEEQRKAEEAEMQKILSPEKFQKFKDMRQKQMDRMKDRMQNRNAGGENQ